MCLSKYYFVCLFVLLSTISQEINVKNARATIFYPKKLKIPNHCSYFSAANPALLPYIWAELAVLFAGKSQTALMIFVFSIFLEVTTIYYAYAWFFLSMDKKNHWDLSPCTFVTYFLANSWSVYSKVSIKRPVLLKVLAWNFLKSLYLTTSSTIS